MLHGWQKPAGHLQACALLLQQLVAVLRAAATQEVSTTSQTAFALVLLVIIY